MLAFYNEVSGERVIKVEDCGLRDHPIQILVTPICSAELKEKVCEQFALFGRTKINYSGNAGRKLAVAAERAVTVAGSSPTINDVLPVRANEKDHLLLSTAGIRTVWLR